MREGDAADAGELGEGARRRRERAARRPAARAAALAGGDTTNEEAFLLARLFREGLGSGAPRRQRRRARCPPGLSRALADPALQATVPDLEFAHAVLVLDCDPVDDAPILDLRIRKGVRRHGVRLARRERAAARARPERRGRRCATRPAPARRCSSALDAALGGDDGNLGGAATAAGSNATSVRDARRLPRAAPASDVVILYGERLLAGPRGDQRRAGAAQPRRPARARAAATAPGCSRSRRRRTAAASARPASRPRTARATPTREAGRGRPRRALADGDARRPLPAARRPGPHERRPRRAGRPRCGGAQTVIAHAVDADRHGARARRRRLPGRGLRREGGHARASRRPRPAAAARDRPPGRGSTPGVRAGWQVHRRGRAARRASTSACSPGRWPRSSSSTPSRSTPG